MDNGRGGMMTTRNAEARPAINALRIELLTLCASDSARPVSVNFTAMCECVAAYIGANHSDLASALEAVDILAANLKDGMRMHYAPKPERMS
jgi:hypothetical protein